jgi:F-type H+-transporting ATPase subunit a
MPPQLPFTAFLNHLLAGPVTALLHALHIEPAYPQAPIPNYLAMEILVLGVLLLFFLFVRSRMHIDSPGAVQHLFEGLHNFINDQTAEIVGHRSDDFAPFLVTLGLFILFCNLIGMIPGFLSPTGATPAVPLGCAVATFLYYNFKGMQKHGVGHYLKQFFGPSDPTMPLIMRIPLMMLMLPIEIISHLARMLSLTVRLFANIFAGDMVTLVFFSLVPIGVPVAFLLLHIGVSLLQSYIFVLLATVYLAGAVATEH